LNEERDEPGEETKSISRFVGDGIEVIDNRWKRNLRVHPMGFMKFFKTRFVRPVSYLSVTKDASIEED
jgi:hypothetical protein